MKATGMVRKVDELGRIVLPIEIRRNLDIKEKDALEVFLDEDRIVLKKYVPGDIFTGELDGQLYEYMGKKIARSTVLELAKLVGVTVTE